MAFAWIKSQRSRRRLLAGGAVLACAAAALLLAGCSKGTYAVEIFPEQHYQASTKIQEPPRLEPVPGAVPITGRAPAVDPQTAASLANPLPRSQAVVNRGAEVYRINCAMCHGPGAAGDGPVGDILVQNKYIRPPNLTAQATQGRTDGEIYGLISEGINVMPQFKNMLSDSDRWAVINYLRTLAQQGR
jgi:mono/diheme cytochrome c family protein